MILESHREHPRAEPVDLSEKDEIGPGRVDRAEKPQPAQFADPWLAKLDYLVTMARNARANIQSSVGTDAGSSSHDLLSGP